jgi:phage repressor protein C with HTH and peptisase S24 domain
MDRDEKIRREQGARLAAAREAAGFRSARDAALSNNWKESSYRAHEGGTRTIGLNDAERYVRRFRAEGVAVTAQSILFGNKAERAPAPPADIAMIPIISWVAASQLSDVGEALDPEAAPKIAVSDLPAGDWFVLKVQGDSMDEVAPDGALILINRKEQKLINKKYYVFADRGEATFKQYIEKPTKLLMPRSSNRTHDPIAPPKNLEVVGRVRRVIVDL